jgi:uncharacterized protein (TIGR03067 family)
MRRLALPALGLLLAVTATLTAADAKDEAVKKDRQRYEGTWQVVSLEVDGNKAAEESARKITVINEADGKWTIQVEGKVAARGTSEIDPTKTPKAVDLTVTEGENIGKKALGIYEFEGDTRKVCLAEPGKGRPAEFSTTAGAGTSSPSSSGSRSERLPRRRGSFHHSPR